MASSGNRGEQRCSGGNLDAGASELVARRVAGTPWPRNKSVHQAKVTVVSH